MKVRFVFDVVKTIKMIDVIDNDNNEVETFHASDNVGISNCLMYASPNVSFREYTVTKTVTLGLVDYIKFRLASVK